jgi:hypothetical protein
MSTTPINNQLAGSNSTFLPYFQQAKGLFNFEDLPKEDRLWATALTGNLATQLMNQDPAYHQSLISMYEPIFQKRGETAMKYGLIANAAGSMLKDVPAAFGRAQQAQFAYDQERFDALRRLGTPAQIPNRNYFR